KGIDIKEGLPAPRKKKSSFSKTTKNPSPVAEISRKNYTKRLNPGDIKERTIGILGQKGTGKTYYTRQLIERMGDGCVCFDTIGALKPSNCKRYEVVQQNIEQQAIGWGVLSSHTKQSISINLKRLIQKEIVIFSDTALRQADYNDKTIAIDEIADYVPESATKSQEMERLIRHGRNQGNAFIFNTQRPAQISKNTLNLVDILVVFRLVWNRDIEVMEELLNNIGVTDIKEQIHKITNLKKGEYKLYSFV
ncbi:unnamed protein product, partial [marine sediment metagenome]